MSRVLAAHQPNYVPWLGFFYKILKCDIFLISDNVQYTKNSFINRNLIKTPNGKKWLTVNVQKKGIKDKAIKDVKINNETGWRDYHWHIIRQSYTRSPHFNDYAQEIASVYQNYWQNLFELNESLIKICCKILGIHNLDFIRGSLINAPGKGTDQIIEECRATGADTYISGYGGARYMEEEKFTRAGIKLVYSDFEHPTYRQLWGDFVPNLSVLDLIFNAGFKSANILHNACKSGVMS